MFEEYGDDAIGIGPDARAPQLLQITRGVDGTERMWQVRQVLDDPNKDHDWAITALVDLDRCDGAGEVLLSIQQVGPST
jgi:imidazole glycerol phosphate synthase subunit HisF